MVPVRSPEPPEPPELPELPELVGGDAVVPVRSKLVCINIF